MNHQDHRRCCADSGDFTTSDLDSCWAPRNPLMPLSLINCWGRRRASEDAGNTVGWTIERLPAGHESTSCTGRS